MVNRNGSSSARERLLEAADDLFYREGIHTVGIERVLEKAGVAKATLYSTFGSKDELVREYMRGRSLRLRGRILEAIRGVTGGRERILAIFDALIERTASPTYHGCAFIRAAAEGAPGPNTAREEAIAHRAWCRQLFVDLAREAAVADPDTLGKQLSLLYDGASVAVGVDGDKDAPRSARRAVERLLSAVTVPAV